MAADYVSPFDERVRAAEPLAPRPASISGRRVVLLDIRKNRGAEFLDRIETLLQAAGAVTARTAKEFKIVYQKQPGATPGTYTMDHSAGTFIFDPQGRLRLYVGYGQGPEVFVHDLEELLHAQG